MESCRTPCLYPTSGHGEIVRTKDGYMVYLGRINPSWTEMVVAQGGFYRPVLLGKTFIRKLGEALNSSRDILSLNPGMAGSSLDLLEFGGVVLGPESDVYSKGWVNPYSMGQCNSTGDLVSWFANFANDFLNTERATVIPHGQTPFQVQGNNAHRMEL
ncbi:hypothetical protein L3N51_02308 [Metallosphaera sp. J1]|uniref:hypothetical protein n=1 Tax=Metallosphaera javensis (ex Hofmann et al. 2022) TaxID=99938 RepID=UPI001EDDC153|nr:hypothetical protein [Metallosphaera javensis (ex Hofmann et al. 2022)]MCG3110011.1 hypothetical protein [Metallosphaera javensis (ex Hofmann et al. 2022)]